MQVTAINRHSRALEYALEPAEDDEIFAKVDYTSVGYIEVVHSPHLTVTALASLHFVLLNPQSSIKLMISSLLSQSLFLGKQRPFTIGFQ